MIPIDQSTIDHIRSYWGGNCGDEVHKKMLWNNASGDIALLLAHVDQLEGEVRFLTEVRSNQAHLIKCLQSEVANLRTE
jgi:hypothetical protein